jgi:hypothetical protein
LITVWPIETCPSPPITTFPALRTVKMVVPCQTGDGGCDACMGPLASGRFRNCGARLQLASSGAFPSKVAAARAAQRG